MRTVLAFSLSALAVLALVAVASRLVGLSPMMPGVSNSGRAMHIWIALAAVAIIAAVDALVIWLTLRAPASGSSEGE